MKQISSLELHFLLKELEVLKDSRVNKIFNNGKEELYIQFHKSNVGRKILRIISGKTIFLSEDRDVDEVPSEFCKMLRKNLEGKFLDSVEQLESERILKFIFKSKDEVKKLYMEFFGRGNVILCNDKDIIISPLIHHRFKDRSIVSKEKYQYPHMDYNLFKISNTGIKKLLKNSKKDTLVTALAVELGLGGIYSEEVCLSNKIDKNIEPQKIKENEIKKIYNTIKKIIKSKTNPQIIYKNKEAVDVVPIDLKIYENYDIKKYSNYNEALDEYFTNELKSTKKSDSVYTKKIDELKRIIDEQKDTMKNMGKKEIELRQKGELIYHNYQLINEILSEVNKAKEKYSWQDIKKKLKGHKVVKDIDIKEKNITIEINR